MIILKIVGKSHNIFDSYIYIEKLKGYLVYNYIKTIRFQFPIFNYIIKKIFFFDGLYYFEKNYALILFIDVFSKVYIKLYKKASVFVIKHRISYYLAKILLIVNGKSLITFINQSTNGYNNRIQYFIQVWKNNLNFQILKPLLRVLIKKLFFVPLCLPLLKSSILQIRYKKVIHYRPMMQMSQNYIIDKCYLSYHTNYISNCTYKVIKSRNNNAFNKSGNFVYRFVSYIKSLIKRNIQLIITDVKINHLIQKLMKFYRINYLIIQVKDDFRDLLNSIKKIYPTKQLRRESLNQMPNKKIIYHVQRILNYKTEMVLIEVNMERNYLTIIICDRTRDEVEQILKKSIHIIYVLLILIKERNYLSSIVDQKGFNTMNRVAIKLNYLIRAPLPNNCKENITKLDYTKVSRFLQKKVNDDYSCVRNVLFENLSFIPLKNINHLVKVIHS